MNSRRQFIRITSLGASAIIFGGGAFKAMSEITSNEAKNLKVNLKRTPTYCEVCFWKCAGWVYTNEKGEIWKVIGNEDDPNCNGRFCPRGTGGIGMYYDKDRLKQPLLRVGQKGDQTFKEVSWDEAFDFIATKM